MSYNKKAKNKLMVLYSCRDMLTLYESKYLVFHHIIKKEFNGKSTVKNGATLKHVTHQWLHSLEIEDEELFNLINECLQLYKCCMDLKKTKLIKQYEREVVPAVKFEIENYKNSNLALKREIRKRTSHQKVLKITG